MEIGKYIVLNELNIIIFDSTLSHKEVAAGFANSEVTSAGFIVTDIDPNGDDVRVQCYGRSVTLDIPSDPESDASLAKYALGIF